MRERRLKALAALGAVCLPLFAAPAATVSFAYTANDGSFFGSATYGTGSFTTAADEGAIALADVTDFTIDGTLFNFIFDGDYSVTLADLKDFSAILANGTVTSLAFSTAPVAVPIFIFSDQVSLTVAGLDAGNLTVASVNNDSYTGDLTISGFTPTSTGTATVPEPASWAMLVAGFGIVGGALRRRRTTITFA